MAAPLRPCSGVSSGQPGDRADGIRRRPGHDPPVSRTEAGDGVKGGERSPSEPMESGVDPKENPEVKALR